MRKLLLLSLASLFFVGQLLAQKTITGKVVDEKGDPLPNVTVTVTVKGSTVGTTSKEDGSFSISVSDASKTLVFSSVNMLTTEVAIGSNTFFNVSLKQEDASLTEVVVVGYGTQKKKELTGSVSSIKASQIKNIPLIGPDQALQGRVAGVNVTQSSGTPGSSINVNVRGIGSISGGSQPLYVIDGIPITTGSFSQIGVGNQTLNALADINPNEIESFEILKDAAAVAIYGSRAANGVVLITTKRGANQKAKINYSTYMGQSKVAKQIEPLTGPEYIALIQEGLANRVTPLTPAQAGLPSLGGTPSSYPSTNWQNLIFQAAVVQNHDISVQGGNERTKFFTSANYFQQEGIIKGSEFERFNVRMNMDNNLSSKIKISTNIALSRSISTRIENDNNINGVLSAALLMGSHIPAYNANGTYGKDPNASVENPLAAALEPYNKVKNNRILINVSGDYKITPNLTFTSRGGVDYIGFNEHQFKPTTTNSGAGVKGFAVEAYNQSTNLINENILAYNKSFNKHTISATAVASYQLFKFESLFARAENFPGNSIIRLSGGSVKKEATSDGSSQGILGYVGRFNYAYNSKYIISGSVRRDGASNFGANRRWGTFPSISGAWRISEEGFMRGIKPISELKLRGSWGKAGNAAFGLFASRALIGVGANYITNAGLAPTQLGNPDLGWEATEQVNLAMDLGLLNNRINLTVELFKRNTNDLLLSRPLVASSGFTSISENIGSLENKGIEFTLSTVNVKKSSFNWTTDFNISFQENMVTKLAGAPFAAGFASWVEAGKPLGSFRGYRVVGLFQTQAEIAAAPFNSAANRPGDIQFRDLNKDNAITAADQEVFGNALPKFYGGLTNNLSYKGFELSVFVQFVYGNDIWNHSRAFSEGMNSVFGQAATVRNRWTPTNTKTNIPRAQFGDQPNNRRNSDRWLEDGSFARIKNLTLAYNIPESITKKWRMGSAKFFIQGQNLYTFTNYSGLDPEVSTFSVTNTAPGTDFLTFPQPRTLTAGINIIF